MRTPWIAYAALALLTTPAAAQKKDLLCLPNAQFAEFAEDAFGERVQFEGVDEKGTLIKVYASARGTWTLTISIPGSGSTCFVTMGEGWAVDMSQWGIVS